MVLLQWKKAYIVALSYFWATYIFFFYKSFPEYGCFIVTSLICSVAVSKMFILSKSMLHHLSSPPRFKRFLLCKAGQGQNRCGSVKPGPCACAPPGFCHFCTLVQFYMHISILRGKVERKGVILWIAQLSQLAVCNVFLEAVELPHGSWLLSQSHCR